MHRIVERITAGESLRDLTKDIDGSVAVVKFHRGLTILRSLTTLPRSTKPAVFWFSGSTGSGKTRCAFEFASAIGLTYEDVWISSGSLQWFDGYDGQRLAVFDDFRAKHVEFSFLLRLLDRYPIRTPFKGGFVNFNPHHIIITCPYSIERCFSKRFEHIPEDLAQLTRRISSIFDFDQFHLSPAQRLPYEALCNSTIRQMCIAAGLPDHLLPKELEEELTIDFDDSVDIQ